MNRLTAALAAATMLGIAGPVAAQSMQGMDHRHAGHDHADAEKEAGGEAHGQRQAGQD
jgi:hypothetical protein